MKIAVYPGSFDPMTNGHIDILNRALDVFDKVVVLIAVNPKKKYHFTIEEKIDMIKKAVKDDERVIVDSCTGLTVDYARKIGAKHLIRGLRAVTDFEYEFQLAAANNFADEDIDMVFFMSKSDTSFISSSTVMELYENGIDVSRLVPKSVLEALNKLNK